MDMENLYQVLQDTSIKNLHDHEIKYFDTVIEKYPSDYKKIISYINECYNYHSPFLVDEKDWGLFLIERFRANNLSEDLRSALMEYESEEVVFAMASFLAHQKQSTWTTLVTKQDLRISMLAVMKKHGIPTKEKKDANELVSMLDIEINDIYERLKQEQKRFGNHKGYEQVKVAKNRFVINIAQFID
jgi:hypothetical protein